MLTVRSLTTKPCFLCSATETAEVRMKDGTFTGVVCKDHLWAILRKNADSVRTPKQAEASEVVAEAT